MKIYQADPVKHDDITVTLLRQINQLETFFVWWKHINKSQFNVTCVKYLRRVLFFLHSRWSTLLQQVPSGIQLLQFRQEGWIHLEPVEADHSSFHQRGKGRAFTPLSFPLAAHLHIHLLMGVVCLPNTSAFQKWPNWQGGMVLKRCNVKLDPEILSFANELGIAFWHNMIVHMTWYVEHVG